MKKVKIDNYPMVSPTPIIIVGVNVNNRENYTTVGAFGVVCLAPIFYISLKSTHYSTLGVRENGFFSVNLPSADMVRKTDYCGMVSGHTVDKSTVFQPFYDELGKAPMISESPMNYLCKVIKSIQINDFEVFFGEIIATYINDNCLTEGKANPLKVNPTIGMGAAYYSLGEQIGNVFREGAIVKKQIFLAGGCFWGTQAYFSKLKGVTRTLCGYANGKTANPTYEEVCGSNTGHAETVLVEYDPSVISTEKLFTEFFKTIDPTTKNRQGNDAGTQYRSGIYFVDEADAPVIQSYIANKQAEYAKPIVTEVLPLSNFYPAEEYHQHYLDKNPNGYCHVDFNLINEELLR